MEPRPDGASLLHLDTAFGIRRAVWGAPTWEPCTVGPGRRTQVHPSIKSYSCGHCLSERELPGRGHRGSQGVGPLDYPLASPD